MDNELRIQDLTARVSGINLKSTIRMLRGLALAAPYIGEPELAKTLNRLLDESAYNGGEPAPLDAKPLDGAVSACEEVFDGIIKKEGWGRIRALQNLDMCPHYALAVTDEEYLS